MSAPDRKAMLDRAHPGLSVRRHARCWRYTAPAFIGLSQPRMKPTWR